MATPWLVTDNFGEGKRLHMVWADGVLIARTCSEPGSEQHARLFAAAPELLAALTTEDVDQIIDGIDHFCIGPIETPELREIWQPYIDKLTALRTVITKLVNP